LELKIEYYINKLNYLLAQIILCCFWSWWNKVTYFVSV